MNKYVLVIMVVMLSASPTESFSKDKDPDKFDPNFLKPETVERILDTASKEAKENIGPIKKLYKEYMKSIIKFANDMINLYKQNF